MKIANLLAAGLMIAGLSVSTSASAQRYDGYSQNDRHDGDRRDGRGDDRRYDRRDDNRNDRRDDRRWSNHGNGNHYGWPNRYRQHCRTEWRHHHRVRICR